MSEKTKKIAPKNYVIYGLICILTIVLVFYLSMWYETRKEYYKNNSVMSELLAQINQQELTSYTLENPNSIIYVASSKDEQIKSFEKELKKFVLDNEINNQMVYLDISQSDNVGLKNTIKTLVPSNLKVDSFNIESGINFIIFENGQVKAILHKDSDSAQIDHVKNFFTVYEIVEE